MTLKVRLGRQEVPKEVGSLDPKGKSPEQTDLESLSKTVQRLNEKLGKLEASLRKPAAHHFVKQMLIIAVTNRSMCQRISRADYVTIATTQGMTLLIAVVES